MGFRSEKWRIVFVIEVSCQNMVFATSFVCIFDSINWQSSSFFKMVLIFCIFLLVHCFFLKTEKLKTFREWIAFIHYLLSIYHFIFFPWGKLVLRESFGLCEPAFFPSGKQKGWKFPSALFLFVPSIAQTTPTPSGWLLIFLSSLSILFCSLVVNPDHC